MEAEDTLRENGRGFDHGQEVSHDVTPPDTNEDRADEPPEISMLHLITRIYSVLRAASRHDRVSIEPRVRFGLQLFLTLNYTKDVIW